MLVVRVARRQQELQELVALVALVVQGLLEPSARSCRLPVQEPQQEPAVLVAPVAQRQQELQEPAVLVVPVAQEVTVEPDSTASVRAAVPLVQVVPVASVVQVELQQRVRRVTVASAVHRARPELVAQVVSAARVATRVPVETVVPVAQGEIPLLALTV